MTTYTHEEFMRAKGNKLLAKKGLKEVYIDGKSTVVKFDYPDPKEEKK